jgi:hypothetical protein
VLDPDSMIVLAPTPRTSPRALDGLLIVVIVLVISVAGAELCPGSARVVKLQARSRTL